MKKRILSALLTLCMVLTLLPAVGFTAGAAGSTSEFQKIMDAAKDAPAGFDPKDENTNPYGHGKKEAFLLNEENELMLFQTFNLNKTDPKETRAWTTWYDRYSNIPEGAMDLAVNTSNDKGGFAEAGSYGSTPQAYCYVQGVAFDPTGSGRKDHVAYVGYRPDSKTNAGTVEVWVLDATQPNAQSAPVVLNTLTLPAGLNQYQSGAILSITAGHYGGGTKEHLIVYSQGRDKTYGLREFSYINGRLHQVADVNPDKNDTLRSRSFDGLHGQYVNGADGKSLYESMNSDDMGKIGQRLYASLDTGDFNGDGVDDLAMVSYMGQPDDSGFKKLNHEYYEPVFSVIYGDGREIEDEAKKQEIVLLNNGARSTYLAERGTADKDGKRTDISMVSPGIACGDTDGDGEDEIVVAGFQNPIKLQANSENVEKPYDIKTEKLQVTAYNAGSGLNQICFKEYAANEWTAGGADNSDKIWQPLGMACVAIDGKGNQEYVFLSGDLCTVDKGGAASRYPTAYFADDDDGAGGAVINRDYLSSVVVGNFDGNAYGREQVACSIGLKETGKDDYHFKLGMVGGSGYGHGREGSGVGSEDGYGAIAQSFYSSDIGKAKYVISGRGDNREEKLNCFLVDMDRDQDGQMARYVGKKYAYSDPTVQAVLQAAPYFGELGGFAEFNEGSTSYSASNSYEMRFETTEEKSFGVGVASEVAAPGIKVGMESGYTAAWSKSFEESFTKTWTDEFTAGAYDKVILQRTPVFIYLYEVFRNGAWTSANIQSGMGETDAAQLNANTIQVSIPKKPAYYTMSVGNYNEFVDFYNGQSGVTHSLKKLNDNYLGSEGNPWGYRDDKWQTTEDGAENLSKSNKSLSYDGGSATSTYERASGTTEGVSQTNGFEFDLTVSTGGLIGVAEAWVGASSSFAYSKGHGKYKSEATSEATSGTVCNLDDPDGSVLRDYKFEWTFGKWNCDLGGAGTVVPIFGYALSGLVAPVAPVTDLAAKIVGEGAVGLAWTAPAASSRPEAKAYNVYRLDENSEYVKLNNEPLAGLEFTVGGLDSNTQYTFVLTSLDEKGNEGIWSNEAVITTPRQNFYVYLTADDTGAVDITAYHLGNLEIHDGDPVPEETIVYVEITPAEDSVITGVTLSMGGKEENITTPDGKFNFALKGAASISVTTASIVTADSFVSYQPRYAVAGLTPPPVMPPAEQPQVEAPAEQQQAEPPAEQPQVEAPAEQQQAEPPAEQAQAELPAEQQQAEPPTKQKPAEQKPVMSLQATQDSEILLGTVSAAVDGMELPSSGGYVTGAVEFTAHPEPGYALREWTISTEGQSDRTILAVGKDTLTFYPYAAKHQVAAVFVDETDASVQRTVTVYPSMGGSVVVTDEQGQILMPDENGRIAIQRGKQFVFSADAEKWYRLKSWTGAFSHYKDNAESIERSVLEDMTVGAEFFAPLKYPVTFSAVSMDAGDGTLEAAADGSDIATGAVLVPETVVDFTATAKDGSRLRKWGFTVGGVETFKDLDDVSDDLITAEEYHLPIQMTTDVRAYFKPIEKLAVRISIPENGGITVTDSSGNPVKSGDSQPYGSKLTITAVANDGYGLSSLTVNGVDFPSGGSYALTGDITINAVFSEERSNNSGGGGGGSVRTVYNLTFETNGGSDINKVSESGGAIVSLSDYVPTREGYDFAGWYSDEALTEKVTSVKLSKDMTVYAKWTKATKVIENPFDDVPDGAYYHDAVLWALENNVTSGTGAAAFAPDGVCTRAQTVTFLWRAMGSPEPSSTAAPFIDVSADAYYYKAVLWAVENGITKGTGKTAFSPDMNCTRAHVVTFLYRTAGLPEVTANASFTDVTANAYYAKAVAWAVREEITKGTSATAFSPNAECTRAQIVTFLYRHLSK